MINKEKRKEYMKIYMVEYHKKNKEKHKIWILNNREKIRESNRLYYKENTEQVLAKNKRWIDKNTVKVNTYKRKWEKDNPEKVKESRKRWTDNNPDYIKPYNKENKKQYYLKNKETCSERMKKYYINNREKILEMVNEYRLNNPEKVREIKYRWGTMKRKTDNKFNLNHKISRAIHSSLKGNKAGRHWETLVGYTLFDLFKRLKKTIPEGYTWQDCLNGNLHIDHKIPISAHNFTKPEHIDFRQCWALSNLQLLPARENLIKGSKLTRPFQPALKI